MRRAASQSGLEQHGEGSAWANALGALAARTDRRLPGGTRRRRLRRAVDRADEPLEGRLLLSALYVDDSATGANTGADWANAFTSLQSALLAADARPGAVDEIRVARGTYTPGAARTDSFGLRNNLALRGGYAGAGAADPNARDLVRLITTLSGEIGSPATNADNSYHVVTANGAVGRGAVLDGFTVAGGNADGPWATPTGSGGGLYNDSASPTVIGCTFSDNAAASGGGVWNYYGSPAFSDCTFNNNRCTYGGGGLTNGPSLAFLTRCTFTGNTASYGGGVYNVQCAPVLTDCTFTANTAQYSGGAMDNSGSAPSVIRCTFRGNSAWEAGAMYNTGSRSPQVIECTFDGNSAQNAGGAVYNQSSSSAILTNCAFSGNSAGSTGGALANDSYSACSVTNCTFAGNTAGHWGAAVYNYTSTATLANCIVWGNTGGQAIFNHVNSQTTAHHSLVQGGWPGAANFSADALFTRNPNPGADGVWDTAATPSTDDDYGDLRPGPGSPAVDAGDRTAPPPSTTDVAGQPRVVGAAVDLGAYEQQPPVDIRLYEAEAATIGGGAFISTARAGYTGAGFVDYLNPSGDFVEFAVDAGGAGGRFVLAFRYANGGATPRAMALQVNGAAPADGGGAAVSVAPTGSWSTWRIVRTAVTLPPGVSRVRLLATGQSGPNLDSLTAVPAAGPVYQAEAARVVGAITAASVPGFGGTGYADYQHASGDWVEFTIDVPADGAYVLDFRYANGSTADRPLALAIDGQAAAGAPMSFAPTSAWSVWATASRPVMLAAGRHTVRLTSIGQNGPNLDALTVREATPPPSVVTLEAEAAARHGAVVSATQPGYSGTGFVDYVNATGDWVEWTVNAIPAGAYELTFRFANGGQGDRPLELRVNGTLVQPALSFPSSFMSGVGWSDWRTVTLTVQLAAGANTVRLTAIGQSGPNLDSLTVRPVVTPALVET